MCFSQFVRSYEMKSINSHTFTYATTDIFIRRVNCECLFLNAEMQQIIFVSEHEILKRAFGCV